jgi:hypothetical protein
MRISEWGLFLMAFASTTVTPGSDGGSGAGTGSGSGDGGTGAGAGAGTPAATPTVQTPTTANLDWKSAPEQFRNGYDALKKQHEDLQKQFEPWKTLNVQPGQVGQFQQGYQQVYSEVKGIADSLNVSENEVAEAIRLHGVLPVLDQLRYEAQQAQAANSGDQAAIQQRDLENRMQEIADQKLSPIMQRENQRLVHEGNALVERTVSQLASDAFKTAGLDFSGAPAELKNFILTGVTEALKYDSDGMRALKYEGKTASIQRAFQTFQSMWDAAYTARRTMESKMVPNRQVPGQRTAPVNGKLPTIDDMINDPNAIRTAQGKPSYAT